MPSIGGKAFVPQRQEQEHSPPLPTLPLPCTVAGLDEPIAAPEAAGEAAATAVAMVVATVVVVDVVSVAVPLCAIAIAMKAAWVLLAVGLILKVMPLPQ